MEIQVHTETEKIIACIRTWNDIEAISFRMIGDDTYDPYFTLLFDAYYETQAPSKVERKQIFSFAEFVESSRVATKDRMLIDNIPVRINYKSLNETESLIEGLCSETPRYYIHTTYPLWRIQNFELRYAKNDRFVHIQERLRKLPESFWLRQLRILKAKLEHVISDMRAALFSEDNFFFLVSTSAFARDLTELLHVQERIFIPSDRLISASLAQCSSLSDELKSRVHTFFRSDSSLSHKQRFELAELISHHVLAV